MLHNLREKINSIGNDNARKRHSLREYLQLLILKILDEEGYFRSLAFVGGTALRILYDLNRFSEDLDFCLIEKKFSFQDMVESIEKKIQQRNLDVEIKANSTNTVAVVLFKFPHLLFDMQLSSLQDQKVIIKLEIDQNPPKGYHTQFTMVNKEFLIGINHFDLSSLFATKLHAMLCRKYTKGRDFYDFIWYVSKKIQPNYTLLENAMKQTDRKNLKITSETLEQLLQDKINTTNFDHVGADVLPFLENAEEARFFNRDFFLQLVKQMYDTNQ